MAQLAATEKALYYPTDQRIIRLFLTGHASFSHWNRVSFFDPCLGEGLALATVMEGCPSWSRPNVLGIELEAERAKTAKKNKAIHYVAHAAFEQCSFRGKPGLIWMNPPYDNINGKRTELLWINMVAHLVRHSMILVLPERFMKGHEDYDKLRMCLYRNKLRLVRKGSWMSKAIGAFKFPDPEFDQFKQYILVVEKDDYMAQMEEEIPIEGVIGECDTKFTIKTHTDYVHNNSDPSPFTIDVRDSVSIETVITEENLASFVGKPAPEVPIIPLQPMIDEILAAVIAGGMFSGIQVGETVIRGGVQTEKIKSEVITNNVKEEYETQKMTALVSELSLESGDVTTYTSDKPEFGVRIEAIAKSVRDIMHKNSPSIYQEDMLDHYLPRFADVHAPRTIKGHHNGLMPAQKRVVAMTLKGWEKKKGVILLGKMGTGKTITSIAAAVGQVRYRASDMQKIVILLPSKDDLVRKWKEEIARSCRDIPHSIFDIEKITETREAFTNPGLTFVLVKESMVKRTSGWEHLSQLKGKCWNCGSSSKLVTIDGELPQNERELLYCDNCHVSYKMDIRNQNNGAYASLARYINDHYKNSYVLIMDEAHQFKGGDTARGYASGSLARGAWRTLSMTGTFYNGYASSMFFTLFRTQGSFREGNTYDGVGDFVSLYGLEQKITRAVKSDKTYSWSGYGVKKTTKTKELPGIHPAMIALMLPYTVFMKIEDFGKPEYDKVERTLFVDLPADVQTATSKYLSNIFEEAKRQMKAGGSMSLMSQLTWAKSGCYDTYPFGDYVDGFKLPAMRMKEMAPKEEAILRYVQMNLANNYPTLIYYLQTDRRAIHGRLGTWFEKYGMKLAYMPSTCNNRIDFVNNALKAGAHAILCNPNLVREGIDLLQFGGIAWYSDTPDAVLVDQANARIYRPLIQDHHVNMIYLAYNGTRQSEQWATTAKKVAAMSAVHGDIRKGLASLLGEESLIATVQDHLIQYERKDSQWTINDLPPLKVWETKLVIEEKEEPVEIVIPIKASVKAADWRPKGYEPIEKVKQLSLF